MLGQMLSERLEGGCAVGSRDSACWVSRADLLSHMNPHCVTKARAFDNSLQNNHVQQHYAVACGRGRTSKPRLSLVFPIAV